MNMQAIRIAVLVSGTVLAGALPILAQDTTPTASPMGQQAPGGQYGHRDPAQMEARQLEMLTHRLNLTPDQVTQVKAIDEAQRTQMMAVRQDSSMQQEDKRGRMMSLRQESEGKIRGVLTDEQKPKYDAMLARQREHMGHRPDGAGGPPQPPASPPQ